VFTETTFGMIDASATCSSRGAEDGELGVDHRVVTDTHAARPHGVEPRADRLADVAGDLVCRSTGARPVLGLLHSVKRRDRRYIRESFSTWFHPWGRAAWVSVTTRWSTPSSPSSAHGTARRRCIDHAERRLGEHERRLDDDRLACRRSAAGGRLVSDPFLGEIKLVPYGFEPKGWAYCDGRELPINQNQALFALLGTNFGGNGTTTFRLPDLRGRVPSGRARRRPGRHMRSARRAAAESVKLALANSRRMRTPFGQAAAPRRPKKPANAWPAAGGAVRGDLRHDDGRHDDRPLREREGARQPAAVPRPRLRHRPAGDLPVSQLSAAVTAASLDRA